MITVSVVGGPSASVAYVSGMTAQQAMEAAYNQIASPSVFNYALQYYGSQLGNMVIMINGTYDTFNTTGTPYFFWDVLYNGAPANTGISHLVLNDGDDVSFTFITYNSATHSTTLVQAKMDFLSSIAE